MEKGKGTEKGKEKGKGTEKEKEKDKQWNKHTTIDFLGITKPDTKGISYVPNGQEWCYAHTLTRYDRTE